MWNSLVDAIESMIGPALALAITLFLGLGILTGALIVFGPLFAIAGLPTRNKHGLELREEEADLPHYHAH